MSITVNGNSIIINNATITVNNAFDPTTGTATITITPSGGLGTLPALLAGQSGPSAQWRNVNMTQVAYGSSLPSPPASVTLISPGGPGTPAVYDLNIALNSGAPGSAGSFFIGSANDWSGTPTQGAFPIWNAGTSKFNPQLPTKGYYWASSINSVSGALVGAQTLSSITIPAQPAIWYPICSGQAVVAGTINTSVTLSANIGSTSGNQVAVGYGVTGTPLQNVSLSAAPPIGSATGYPQIAAGSGATIVFSATQTASTGDSWATSSATSSFSVQVVPA